jgi:HSP20 family protein
MAVFPNPFNELLRLQQELEGLLNRPASDLSFGPSAAGVYPPVNVFRNKEGDLVIRAELPGVKAEDIDVNCEARRLTISGERKPETDGKAAYHRRERPSGKFSRAIHLPADLDVEHAEARFQNGVMTLRIPRAQAAKPRQIAVQVA